MFKYWLIAGMIIMAGAVLTGCDMSEDIEASNQLAEALFRAFDSGDMAKIEALCSPKMLEEKDAYEHLEKLIRFHDKLGEYQTSTLYSWNETKQVGGETFINAIYTVIYAKDSAMESLLLIRDDKTDSLKVLGYNIASQAFLDDI